MPKGYTNGVPVRFVDLAGQTFGSWTVLRDSGKRTDGSRGSVYWTCRCACGRESDVRATHLRRGLSTRCRACANASMRRRPVMPVARPETPTVPTTDEHEGRRVLARDANGRPTRLEPAPRDTTRAKVAQRDRTTAELAALSPWITDRSRLPMRPPGARA